MSEEKAAPAQLGPEQAALLALKDPRTPRLYGNQFSIITGVHDITVLLGVNTVPTGVLNMTYPLAKLLARLLTDGVAEYEKVAGPVPEIAQIEAKLNKGSAK